MTLARRFLTRLSLQQQDAVFVQRKIQMNTKDKCQSLGVNMAIEELLAVRAKVAARSSLPFLYI